MTLAAFKKTIKIGDRWTIVASNVPNHPLIEITRAVIKITSKEVFLEHPRGAQSSLLWPADPQNFRKTDTGFMIMTPITGNLLIEYQVEPKEEVE